MQSVFRFFPVPAGTLLCAGLGLILSAAARNPFPDPNVLARPGPAGRAPLGNGSVTLSAEEVEAIVRRAAESVGGERLVVAVADRKGRILAVWHRPLATESLDELAVSLARTGAFFSNDQAPLSSRTVRFISGIHFPPGVKNQPSGALYGIENTNRVAYNVQFNPGLAFPYPLNIEESGPSPGITTGKRDLFDSDPRAVNPGGIPIFKNGRVAGGIGVAGVSAPEAEFAAFAGSVPDPATFGPRPAGPGVIFVEGIKLPFVQHRNPPAGLQAGSFPGTGSYRLEPVPGEAAPDGYLVGPEESPELSLDDVTRIIEASVETANRTRALIRLPIGSRTRMVIAVGDLDGNILALFRMPDSTVFSLDVAVAKARNVVYFSNEERQPEELPGLPVGTAVTNRTLSFGAQPLFPAGINNTRPGPFFDLFRFDTENPGSQGFQASNPNQNGIVFFPGSVPLYKNGKLAGGLGISGDGVEQDDYVAFQGGREYQPPAAIRADQHLIRGVRMPYLKFPRNPTR
jgi:uncharacterized protein GlcG (DUF336 family)